MACADVATAKAKVATAINLIIRFLPVYSHDQSPLAVEHAMARLSPLEKAARPMVRAARPRSVVVTLQEGWGRQATTGGRHLSTQRVQRR